MRYGSICSGIEAATVATKQCSRCRQEKPLGEFHKQPSGTFGRFCYCKDCANVYARSKRRIVRPSVRRERNYRLRYGLSSDQVAQMLADQGGVCAICGEGPVKPCVDHDHARGKVRSILCQPCNVALPHVENVEFREKALAYLKGHQ